jgi:DNA-binding LytR/AlgR family response regulator
MNCIIIEDSRGALEHLENQLTQLEQGIEILARIDTVEDALLWLGNNTTDIIFMDIQLGDSLSFEIFDHIEVTTPVIFTTSYDAYAIKAFEVNSIAYLLKPVKLKELQQAVNKYEHLYEEGVRINNRVIGLRQGYQERFLVRTGNIMMPLQAENIAYFTISNRRHVLIVLKDKQQFVIDITLELLEQRLNPKDFFRVNRQYIISMPSVKEVIPGENGKLKLILDPAPKEDVTVARERAVAFKAWMAR